MEKLRFAEGADELKRSNSELVLELRLDDLELAVEGNHRRVLVNNEVRLRSRGFADVFVLVLRVLLRRHSVVDTIVVAGVAVAATQRAVPVVDI